MVDQAVVVRGRADREGGGSGVAARVRAEEAMARSAVAEVAALAVAALAAAALGPAASVVAASVTAAAASAGVATAQVATETEVGVAAAPAMEVAEWLALNKVVARAEVAKLLVGARKVASSNGAAVVMQLAEGAAVKAAAVAEKARGSEAAAAEAVRDSVTRSVEGVAVEARVRQER